MGRIHLGRWRCPSGNGVDVYLGVAAGDRPTPLAVAAEWDSFPPSRKDARHWQIGILPEVGGAIVALTGLKTMVVTL